MRMMSTTPSHSRTITTINSGRARTGMKAHKDGRQRRNICPGTMVKIVLKKDQRSGKLTEGTVLEILTNTAFHPHGIKVRLVDGSVGRVHHIE